MRVSGLLVVGLVAFLGVSAHAGNVIDVEPVVVRRVEAVDAFKVMRPGYRYYYRFTNNMERKVTFVVTGEVHFAKRGTHSMPTHSACEVDIEPGESAVSYIEGFFGPYRTGVDPAVGVAAVELLLVEDGVRLGKAKFRVPKKFEDLYGLRKPINTPIK